MGYNHASAFAPRRFPTQKEVSEWPKPDQFIPPYQGEVMGFPVKADPAMPPKVVVGISPDGKQFAVVPAVKNHLLDLRAEWLQEFLLSVGRFGPEIPIPAAVDWVNKHFPRTIEQLQRSLIEFGPMNHARILVEEWRAKL